MNLFSSYPIAHKYWNIFNGLDIGSFISAEGFCIIITCDRTCMTDTRN